MKMAKRHFPAAAGILLFLGLWYVISEIGIFSAYVLPPPGKVWESFLKMCASGEILGDISVSMARVLKGFAIAFVLAFALGMLRAGDDEGSDYRPGLLFPHVLKYRQGVYRL